MLGSELTDRIFDEGYELALIRLMSYRRICDSEDSDWLLDSE